MSADIREPRTTLRLEAALRFMVKVGDVAPAYVARRYDLGSEGADLLKAWLQEFNGGERALTEARIDAVKLELGLVSAARKAEFAAAPAAPAVPEAPVAAAPAADKTTGQVRVDRRVFFIAVCQSLLEHPEQNELTACRKANLPQWAWSTFKCKQFGKGPIDPAKLVAWLQQQGAPVPEMPPRDSARNETPAALNETNGAKGPDMKKPEAERMKPPPTPRVKAEVPAREPELHAMARRIPGTKLFMKLTVEIFQEGGGS